MEVIVQNKVARFLWVTV